MFGEIASIHSQDDFHLFGMKSLCFDGMSQLDDVRRDATQSLPQSMEALRAEPPLAAFMY